MMLQIFNGDAGRIVRIPGLNVEKLSFSTVDLIGWDFFIVAYLLT